MFKKRAAEEETVRVDSSDKQPREDVRDVPGVKRPGNRTEPGGINTILKGSRVTGDIHVTCDIELSGDVVGNITSRDNANILIKGTCKGNIDGGNVHIQGELVGGNITAGNDVRISGKFKGGEVKAGGKIHVNGEFSGKLMGNEIEIGPDARGDGELLYRESISVAKGARIEARVSQTQQPQEQKPAKDSLRVQAASPLPPEKEMREGKALKQAQSG